MRTQRIQFCTSPDGTRIAYAVVGRGRPLLCVAHWLTHLERDWHSCVRQRQLWALADYFRLVRYDARDTGVSDRGVRRVCLDAWTEDLAAVVDATGLEQVPLLASGEVGPVAIRYAVAHPQRVSHLVLLGSFAVGRSRRPTARPDEVEAAATMMRYWWDQPHSGVHQLWTARLIPDGTHEQQQTLDELQCWSTDRRAAVRSCRTATSLDVRTEAEMLSVPTLVLHAFGDAMVPFDCGRELASLIPGATFVPLPTNNHLLLASEPAWTAFLEQIRSFLGTAAPRHSGLGALTPRELELVDLIARGLDNAAIAHLLVISPRTVRNHISHVFAKLGVHSRAETIVLARDSGLGTDIGRTLQRNR